jgi:hypothetical protein
MPDEKQLALPGSSWETVKKIIRAFFAANDEESATVEDIAKLAGVLRPVVSMNNNFLRSVGIVRPDQWKLTEAGLRYATGLQMNNDSMASESLAQAARTNPILSQLLNLLKARGEMKTDTFKGDVIIRLGLNPNDRQAQFIKPLFEMLQEAGLIIMDDDTVALANVHAFGKKGEHEILPSNQNLHQENPPPTFGARLPVLLGPNRLAFIELPKDWDKKDLPKLLKLLEISLGDEM